MNIVFSNNIVKRRDALNAGFKAKYDVEKILLELDFSVKNFDACDYWNYTGFKYYLRKLKWCLGHEWLLFWLSVSRNSILFYQWPFEGEERYARMACALKKLRSYKTICLIHDIISLRSTGDFSDDEVQKMKSYKFDYIVVHNEIMKQLMISKGFSAEKLFVLELFDYYNVQQSKIPERALSRDVIIAGNLAQEKSAYVYSLPETDVTFQLYGQDYKGQIQRNICYNGVFTPEEVLECLNGSFGLVWDGDSVSTCTGRGLYLKYNNPHKVSLYIAAGLPVIIWEEAALAKFICENKLGFSIKSISEISKKISDLTEEQYNNMKSNVDAIATELRSGYKLREQMCLITNDIRQ